MSTTVLVDDHFKNDAKCRTRILFDCNRRIISYNNNPSWMALYSDGIHSDWTYLSQAWYFLRLACSSLMGSISISQILSGLQLNCVVQTVSSSKRRRKFTQFNTEQNPFCNTHTNDFSHSFWWLLESFVVYISILAHTHCTLIVWSCITFEDISEIISNDTMSSFEWSLNEGGTHMHDVDCQCMAYLCVRVLFSRTLIWRSLVWRFGQLCTELFGLRRLQSQHNNDSRIVHVNKWHPYPHKHTHCPRVFYLEEQRRSFNTICALVNILLDEWNS